MAGGIKCSNRVKKILGKKTNLQAVLVSYSAIVKLIFAAYTRSLSRDKWDSYKYGFNKQSFEGPQHNTAKGCIKTMKFPGAGWEATPRHHPTPGNSPFLPLSLNLISSYRARIKHFFGKAKFLAWWRTAAHVLHLFFLLQPVLASQVNLLFLYLYSNGSSDFSFKKIYKILLHFTPQKKIQ